MNKPWFEKKKFGWGWGLPITWQGWVTLALFVLFIASLDFITTNTRVYITLVIAAVAALSITARITSGKPEWSNGDRYTFDKKRIIKIVILLVSIILIFTATQIFYVTKVAPISADKV